MIVILSNYTALLESQTPSPLLFRLYMLSTVAFPLTFTLIPNCLISPLVLGDLCRASIGMVRPEKVLV
jgi:hypothetical protein